MFATIPADKLEQFLSSPPQDNKIYFVQNEKHNYCILNGMSFGDKMKYINDNYNTHTIYIYDDGTIISDDSEDINVPVVENANLIECKIGYGVKTIGTECGFSNCTKLESLTITQKVMTILDGVFTNCPIKYLNYDGHLVSTISSMKAVVNDIKDTLVVCSLGEKISTFLNISLFNGCEKLTEVEFKSSSITKIPDRFFYGCKSLRTVSIPATVTSFGQEVFAYCSSLEKVEVLAKMTELPYRTFYECTNLKEVILESYGKEGYWLKTIGEEAFYNCINLEAVWLKSIYDAVNDEEKLNAIFNSEDIDDDITYINEDSYYSIENPVFYLPTKFSEKCFYNCKNLQYNFDEMMFFNPQSTQEMYIAYSQFILMTFCYLGYFGMFAEVSDYAFYNCENFGKCMFLNGIHKIGNYAFYNTGVKTFNSVMYWFDTSFSIGDYAFANCKNLECFTFAEYDDETNNQNNDIYVELGKYCFQNCVNLKRETMFPELDDATPFYTYIPIFKLRDDNQAYLAINEGIFQGCENLTFSCLGYFNMNNFGEYALFYYMENIGDYAFDGCKNLCEYAVIVSYDRIGKCAFRNCSRMKTIGALAANYIDEYAFANIGYLYIWDFQYMHNDIIEIGENVFQNTYLTEGLGDHNNDIKLAGKNTICCIECTTFTFDISSINLLTFYCEKLTLTSKDELISFNEYLKSNENACDLLASLQLTINLSTNNGQIYAFGDKNDVFYMLKSDDYEQLTDIYDDNRTYEDEINDMDCIYLTEFSKLEFDSLNLINVYAIGKVISYNNLNFSIKNGASVIHCKEFETITVDNSSIQNWTGVDYDETYHKYLKSVTLKNTCSIVLEFAWATNLTSVTFENYVDANDWEYGFGQPFFGCAGLSSNIESQITALQRIQKYITLY